MDVHRITDLKIDTRVVSCLDRKTIAGFEFDAYGAHYDGFPVPYITFACALGMQHREVDLLVTKLRKTIHEWRAKQKLRPAESDMETMGGVVEINK